MQVTSCQRRPTVRRGTPGSSPSNYTSTVPPNNPQQGQEQGEGRPRVRQYGREDAQSQTQRDDGVTEMEQTEQSGSGRSVGGGGRSWRESRLAIGRGLELYILIGPQMALLVKLKTLSILSEAS